MCNNKILILCLISFATFAGSIFITKDECPPNEEYLLCGSTCPVNCTSRGIPADCQVGDCAEGCFCKAGYLRNDNNSCIPADQCPDLRFSICAPNEKFQPCGPTCPATCKSPEPSTCVMSCSMGCFCSTGYVRDEASGNCVTLDNCPTENCFQENEIFDQCNAVCEPSCKDLSPICARICSSGCVCADGYVRSDDGGCIKIGDCLNSNSTDFGLLAKYYNVINKILTE